MLYSFIYAARGRRILEAKQHESEQIVDRLQEAFMLFLFSGVVQQSMETDCSEGNSQVVIQPNLFLPDKKVDDCRYNTEQYSKNGPQDLFPS